MRGLAMNRGVTALPTILIISAIIVEVVIAMALISYLLGAGGFGVRKSLEAAVAAEAGLQDAAIKITRDKEYEDAGGYDLVVGDNSANVKVVKDSPAAGKHKVTVTGTAGLYSKKIEGIYIVDDTTGKIILESYTELEI